MRCVGSVLFRLLLVFVGRVFGHGWFLSRGTSIRDEDAVGGDVFELSEAGALIPVTTHVPAAWKHCACIHRPTYTKWSIGMAEKQIKIEAVDLYCGAGGLTCGLQQAEIKVLAGVDIAAD